jgi:hypothetical protein
MTTAHDVTVEQMEAFAELGYIVLPKAVPRPRIERRHQGFDDLSRCPP